MLYFFAPILLMAIILYVIVLLMPGALSPAEKLVKQQGRIANKILGKPTGEITLPLVLKEFYPFQIQGNYITDIFTQSYNDETLFSFLLHGRNFYTKFGLNNPLPGSKYVGQTHFRCWLGKIPDILPKKAEVFYRKTPQDIHPFCTQTRFSYGNKELDDKYAFAGDPGFKSFLSQEFFSWVAKNRLYVMISSGWMLLIDPKEIVVPNEFQVWKEKMQNMSAWTTLKDILVQEAAKKA